MGVPLVSENENETQQAGKCDWLSFSTKIVFQPIREQIVQFPEEKFWLIRRDRIKFWRGRQPCGKLHVCPGFNCCVYGVKTNSDVKLLRMRGYPGVTQLATVGRAIQLMGQIQREVMRFAASRCHSLTTDSRVMPNQWFCLPFQVDHQ